MTSNPSLFSLRQVLRLEQDAGAEFRGKIRLLEHKRADLEGTVTSLESQLQGAKVHTEEFRKISQSYEQQLQDSNSTHFQFK